jgi:SNF2 family DNA or RNA helicase
MNNGWPGPFPNPFASQSTSYDPARYLSRIPYDYPVPNPSADEIKDLLANIRPDEDIKVEDTDAIIPGLAEHMRLMKHQQMGLAWMQKMEEGKNKGGLLADEMGLGKTIQRYSSE